MTDSEFLRLVAQNDYMIDNFMLPDGKRLLQIANRIEENKKPQSKAVLLNARPD